MAKLPGVPVIKFRKALQDAGYKKERCKGGHEVWTKIVVNTIKVAGTYEVEVKLYPEVSTKMKVNIVPKQ